MKKSVLCLVGLGLSLIAAAQENTGFSLCPREQSVQIQQRFPRVKDHFVRSVNYSVSSEVLLGDPSLMVTTYDIQTNASNRNCLYVYPDGTIGAAGIMSHDLVYGWLNRGTGYNYFDGTAWKAQPVNGLESSKAGWPTYAPLGSNGEIIVSHSWDQGLFILRSAQKGQGAWTEYILPGPPGATDIEWARVVTNGPNNDYVHIICTSYGPYQGMWGELFYFRSLNGGSSWDINGAVLPGITPSDYLGIEGDAYAWAQPKGNTLCFVVGDSWNDLFLMKSTDNGDTWTKQIIWDCPYDLWNGGTTVPSFWCPDGAVAVALDQNGKAHVTFGVTKQSGDALGNKSWEPYADGLLYWNENMPPFPFDLNPQTLPSSNYIGWVQDPAVFTAPTTQLAWYMKSLSSYPSMVFDQNDNLYVIWSGVTSNLDINNFMLRHLYARGRYSSTGIFDPQIIDLTNDVQYAGRECVFPSVSPTTYNGKISIFFQCDDLAGSCIYGTDLLAQGQTIISQNDLIYKEFSMSAILPTGIKEDESKPQFFVSQNYPNPVKGKTVITVSVEQMTELNLDLISVVGEKMMGISKGTVSRGVYKFELDASHFPSGLYFYTVSTNKESVTRNMLVER